MTVAEAQTRLERVLGDAELEQPRAEALTLLEALLGLSRTQLLLSRSRELTLDETRRLEGWLERRLGREPLQHILGVAPFYGLELMVTPNVLVPRPETERLVELVLNDLRGLRGPRVLDVGTGSGAIALAIKLERSDAVVMASDVSEAALEVARKNAARHGLDVVLVPSDVLAEEEVRGFAARADLVVANLPYLPESDRDWLSPEVRRDPEGALYAGEDGLALYRRLEREAFTLLRPGARLWLELDPRNVDAAAALAGTEDRPRWAARRVLEDLTGRRRFLRLLR